VDIGNRKTHVAANFLHSGILEFCVSFRKRNAERLLTEQRERERRCQRVML
jgi:hypothetical protein